MIESTIELSMQQLESLKKFIAFYCNFDNYETSGFNSYEKYLKELSKQRIKNTFKN